MIATVFIAGIVAATTTLVAPIAVKPLLRRLRAFDVPNHRSSHSKTTLRGGGIATGAGLLMGFAVICIGTNDQPALILLSIVLGSAMATSAIGLAEDLIGLSVRLRVTMQLIVAGILAVLASTYGNVPPALVPLLVVGYAAYVNFANFMDGINGISSLHGVTSGVAYALLGGILDESWLLASGVLIAVVFASFLPWNVSPPGLFLGDVGRYLLGGLVGAVVVVGFAVGLPLTLLFAPMVIYVVDVLTTLVRRIARRQNIAQPHREHTYQRLVQTGLRHSQVALLVAAGGIATTLLALLIWHSSVFPDWLAFLGFALVGLMYIRTPHYRAGKAAR